MVEVARRHRGHASKSGGREEGQKVGEVETVLEVCVVPAPVSRLGAQRHDQKLEVAENNWFRRICGGG